MQKAVKTISVDLDIETHKLIETITKRTGETKVGLFKRMINNEHNRIINGQSLNESIGIQLDKIIGSINEINVTTKKNVEMINSLREGANRIYCSVLLVIKEMFRTMHFISGAFLKTSLHQKEQLSIISNTADSDATDSFNVVYKILNESQPKDIVDILRKK